MCMTSYIYQMHKRTLDELQLEAQELLAGNKDGARIGLRNPETRRQLVRWLTLEPVPDSDLQMCELRTTGQTRYA